MEEKGIGTNIICQIGLVVKDIEHTARMYADVFKMAVPNIIITDPEEETHIKFCSKPTNARAKLAFFKMGSISLELIEPIGEPSTWREFLDKYGEGVHHIAFQIQGMDEVLNYLEGKDIKTVQRGDYKGGRYAYVDSAPKLGVILELLENYKK